jgi:hypothetical protein
MEYFLVKDDERRYAWERCVRRPHDYETARTRLPYAVNLHSNKLRGHCSDHAIPKVVYVKLHGGEHVGIEVLLKRGVRHILEDTHLWDAFVYNRANSASLTPPFVILRLNTSFDASPCSSHHHRQHSLNTSPTNSHALHHSNLELHSILPSGRPAMPQVVVQTKLTRERGAAFAHRPMQKAPFTERTGKVGPSLVYSPLRRSTVCYTRGAAVGW